MKLRGSRSSVPLEPVEKAIAKNTKAGPRRAVRQKAPAKSKIRLRKARLAEPDVKDFNFLTSTMEKLPGREAEFDDLLGTVVKAIQDDEGCCVWTGKTATVHKVISLLKESVEAEEISAFDFLEINGMMHSESSSIYSRLYATIFRSRCANGASIRLLDNHFRSGFATSRRLTIVLLDELDQLVQKKQKLAYNLFEWAHCAGSRLVVIAVANTMDLPERVFKHKIASRLGGSRVNFTPYTHPQLLHILELTAARFSDVKINSSAMEFVCRKIAAVNGDARRLIQAFHRLREAAFASGTGTVTIPLAQKVLAASDTSGSLSGALSGVPFMQLLLLCCCFNQLKRKETTELLFSSVLPLFLQTCQTKTLPLPDIRDISCWLNALNTAQFLHTSFPAHSCLENAKVSLLVGEQELSEACSFDTTLKRLVGV